MTETRIEHPWNDELLSAYLDGELVGDERLQVEMRLRDDPDARELLEELRSVSESFQRLPSCKLDVDLRERVLSRVTTMSQLETVEVAANRRWIYAAAAIAAALLLMFYQGPETADEQPLALADKQQARTPAPAP